MDLKVSFHFVNCQGFRFWECDNTHMNRQRRTYAKRPSWTYAYVYTRTHTSTNAGTHVLTHTYAKIYIYKYTFVPLLTFLYRKECPNTQTCHHTQKRTQALNWLLAKCIFILFVNPPMGNIWLHDKLDYSESNLWHKNESYNIHWHTNESPRWELTLTIKLTETICWTQAHILG